MLRVAQVMDAEAMGREIRTDLEKAKDKLTILRYSDPKYIASVTRLSTAAINRRADVLEARRNGKDIRTELEKAEEAREGKRDTEFSTARKRFLTAVQDRETAIKKAEDNRQDIRRI